LANIKRRPFVNHIFAASGASDRALRPIAAKWGTTMRCTMALAALLAASAAGAQSVAVESAVYAEIADADGVRVVEPVTRFARGDRVVTILRWEAPDRGTFTAVSRIPAGLALESVSEAGLETSSDGGRSWRRLDEPGRIPRDTTHLRWRIGAGAGQLSYRAVVR
jgi:hypothetical protein